MVNIVSLYIFRTFHVKGNTKSINLSLTLCNIYTAYNSTLQRIKYIMNGTQNVIDFNGVWPVFAHYIVINMFSIN